MKRIIFALLLVWSMPAIAQIKAAKLTASGLTCSMCSRAIYKALEKVPSIKNIDANVETSTYEITFKDDQAVELDDVKKAVQNAGFSVASMLVTANFNDAAIGDDAHVNLGGSNFHFMHVQQQKLNGEHTFTIIDKNYLPQAERKKYAKYTTMKCFETGMSGHCCPNSGTAPKRMYHATL